MIAFFARIACLVSLMSGGAQASQYPPEFFHQMVRVIHLTNDEGAKPAFIATVANGNGSQIVIGYKNTGSLSNYKPDYIDAVVIARCETGPGEVFTRTSVVRVGHEWSGNGYLSAPVNTYALLSGCPIGKQTSLALAFSDHNGHWDSQGGKNYSINFNDFYGPTAMVFNSQEAGLNGSEVPNDKVWNFLIDALKQ